MTPKLKLVLAIGACAAMIASSAAAQGGRHLSATLSGGSGGDPDGSGTATLTVNPGQEQICYELSVSGIEPATAAHIHLVATGGIVVPLSAPSGGSIEECVPASRAIALQILKNPSAYYVNVHNATYPGGAISGTLTK